VPFSAPGTDPRIGGKLAQEIFQRGVTGEEDLPAQTIEKVRRVLVEVDDARREPVSVPRRPHHVDRRL
jgi:hypothetical protein